MMDVKDECQEFWDEYFRHVQKVWNMNSRNIIRRLDNNQKTNMI